MYLYTKTALFFAIILLAISSLEGARAEMTAITIKLPETADAWTRSDSTRIVDSNTIFKYMNGAGELYLAYGFDHLEITEYKADQKDDILVEVYVMNSDNDVFGLLSLDWGGEPVTLAASSAVYLKSVIAPPHRALYGQGLLRMGADNIYVRIMVSRETPEARKAILSLGRAIAANRETPAEPDLLKILPRKIGSDWKLRNDRIGYFRTHLVLNSLYYISHRNIFNLNHDTAGVAAPYESTEDDTKTAKRVQFLFVEYPRPAQARQALDHFHNAYLPEFEKGFNVGGKMKHSNYFDLEDGWLSYRLDGKFLAVVFGFPSRESARIFMEHISLNALKKEEGHAE